MKNTEVNRLVHLEETELPDRRNAVGSGFMVEMSWETRT